jgi:hypothetical protein
MREVYSGTEVVMMAELMKLLFSGYLVFAEKDKSDLGTVSQLQLIFSNS